VNCQRSFAELLLCVKATGRMLFDKMNCAECALAQAAQLLKVLGAHLAVEDFLFAHPSLNGLRRENRGHGASIRAHKLFVEIHLV
jgi:hypothetical protein